MMRHIRSLGRDERGTSLIEMALIAPLLAALLVGVVDISRGVSVKLQVEQAAQRSIELIQRSEYKTADKATYEADAQTAAGTGSTATLTAWMECNGNGVQLDIDTGTCGATDAVARYVQMTVQKPFTPMFGTRFFPNANSNGTVTVDATAGIRVQ
ncbi:MAG TPA: TadE/TadG family type IV pilus assembly protein [Sphingomicrobium sp.]|jgi:Flp pilus assembly protein TadG|nr:TadE/TadG family type IV pilus assembly protein [Sphingomicrobium sp.]